MLPAGEAAQVWAPGGCVEVICEEQDWSHGWMGAEAAEALSQVEAAVDSPSAWLPAEQAWDPAASTSPAWDGTKCATTRFVQWLLPMTSTHALP